jgi:dienelactone hydrolase
MILSRVSTLAVQNFRTRLAIHGRYLLTTSATLRTGQLISHFSTDMSSEHCAIGHIHTGTPVGKEETINGRKAYVTGSNKSNALLYLTDVFGYEYNNHRLLADTFAKELPITVYVGDFLGESGFVHLTPEELKNVDFPKFREFNAKEKRFPQILELAEHLKSQYEKVFVIGYCWGAWGAVMLAAKPGLIAGVSLNHPSVVEVPSDLENLKSPTLIVAPYTDHAFPPEQRSIAEKIFDEKAKNEKLFFKIAVYPGFVHGFTARGNTDDEFTNEAVEDAKTESVIFFRKILK